MYDPEVINKWSESENIVDEISDGIQLIHKIDARRQNHSMGPFQYYVRNISQLFHGYQI